MKFHDLIEVGDEECDRNNTVVNDEFGKRLAHRSDKGKTVAIVNVTGDMKRGRKAGSHRTDDKKTFKIYFVKIFGIEEQVWYAHIFPEVSADHSKQNNPAKHQYKIALEIVQ